MGTASRFEYRTIPMPSMDEWLMLDPSLALGAATGERQEELLRKHAAFMDTTLNELGNDGWELLSLWESEPSQLFQYAVKWMTFKRRVA